MAGRGKYFELLDVVKFAVPNALTLDASATSYNLVERVAGRSFMSYGAMWPRLKMLVRGLATDDFIETTFSFYQDDWKNDSIKDAYRLLRKYFGGKGTWYEVSGAPTYVLGFWFKPSIKGFWFYEGKPYAVLINARKGQPLSRDDVRFLARGVYELHCIDDPNNPVPLIVDLSKHQEDQGRNARIYEVAPEEAVPLEAFESSIREFLMALNLAGISLPPPLDVSHILDLFRK
jgi:hypothetical protein